MNASTHFDDNGTQDAPLAVQITIYFCTTVPEKRVTESHINRRVNRFFSIRNNGQSETTPLGNVCVIHDLLTLSVGQFAMVTNQSRALPSTVFV